MSRLAFLRLLLAWGLLAIALGAYWACHKHLLLTGLLDVGIGFALVLVALLGFQEYRS